MKKIIAIVTVAIILALFSAFASIGDNVTQDRGLIAFIGETARLYGSPNRGVYVLDPENPTDVRRISPLEPTDRDVERPTWSPDRSRIATAAFTPFLNIVTIDAKTGGDERILTNCPQCREPIWSPDGEKIAYAGREDASGELYIWIMDADTGENQEKLIQGYEPTWSPDGKEIAFVAFVAPGETRVYVINLEDRAVRRLTNGPGFEGEPEYSPDGTKIAFSKYVGPGQFQFAIFIMDAKDGSNKERVTTLPLHQMYHPTWSPDGKEIAFEQNYGDGPDIYIADVATKELRRLTYDGTSSRPRWSSALPK